MFPNATLVWLRAAVRPSLTGQWLTMGAYLMLWVSVCLLDLRKKDYTIIILTSQLTRLSPIQNGETNTPQNVMLSG